MLFAQVVSADTPKGAVARGDEHEDCSYIASDFRFIYTIIVIYIYNNIII